MRQGCQRLDVFGIPSLIIVPFGQRHDLGAHRCRITKPGQPGPSQFDVLIVRVCHADQHDVFFSV